MTIITDELLKQLAEGTGRCYNFEGKAMAQELREWRRKAREAAQNGAGSTGSIGSTWPPKSHP